MERKYSLPFSQADLHPSSLRIRMHEVRRL